MIRKSSKSRFMLLWVLLWVVFSCPNVSAAASEGQDTIAIENVKLRLIESKSFTRISEFFSGKENTGRRVILRSDPDERGGIYFILRMDSKLTKLPPGLSVGLQYFEAGSAKMQQYVFELPDKLKKTNKLFIGITGDAVSEKQLPVAWRVSMNRADGSLYSELKSYLWEMPDPINTEDPPH